MGIAIEDRLAVEDLVSRYAWASDSRDFAAMERLFVPDGVLAVELAAKGTRSEVRGAQAIAAWVEERHRAEFAQGHRRRHVTTNFVLDACDGATALSRAYICVMVAVNGAAPQAAAMGWYEDRSRKVDGRWLFESRVVRLEGK